MASEAGRGAVLSRFRRTDDGSIAVLAAVTIPVVLLCVALAMATMVWSSSEHEAQRAADAAAARAAATAFLGTDFPYAALPGVTTPITYPDVDAIAAWAHTTPPADVSECGTVGVPPTTATWVTVTAGLTLPLDCSPVGPFAVPPPLTAADSTRAVACTTAKAAMAPETATYANRFYAGDADTQPSCDPDPDGTRRIGVKLATGSPLVGFGADATDAATGALDTKVAPEFGTVAQALGAFGIHLDTALPSLLCPEVSVTVNQPVREPVFDRSSDPDGRATARRIVKNAVVVPVYEGRTITAAATSEVHASTSGSGVDVTLSNGTTQHIEPVNLNGDLLAGQQQLLTLLDEVDAIADAAVRAADVTLTGLNGTYDGIDPEVPQPPPAPATAPLQGLRLTKCLRDTLAQVYDPPSGDAPTASEVLANAAETGDQVVVIQVGAVRSACTEPGAIHTVFAAVGDPDDCIRAATTPTVDPTSGLYEVPFFDATPVVVQDVGDHNYEAVPVHATQASGAFRGGLIRDAENERYDPDVRQPHPTPACVATLPVPTPSTACQILSHSPSPLPTVSPPTVSPSLPLPTIPLPTSPPPTSPLPTLPLPTSPPPTSPLPTLPLPTSPPPTSPRPTCIGILCPVNP
jgi:hypothetical protein